MQVLGSDTYRHLLWRRDFKVPVLPPSHVITCALAWPLGTLSGREANSVAVGKFEAAKVRASSPGRCMGVRLGPDPYSFSHSGPSLTD